MSPEHERRCEGRSGCEAEVEWAYFNRSESLDGRLLNVSAGGGCLESPLEVTGRCTLLVRLKRCSPNRMSRRAERGSAQSGWPM